MACPLYVYMFLRQPGLPKDDAFLSVYLNVVSMGSRTYQAVAQTFVQIVLFTDYTLWKFSAKGGMQRVLMDMCCLI